MISGLLQYTHMHQPCKATEEDGDVFSVASRWATRQATLLNVVQSLDPETGSGSIALSLTKS